MPNDKKPKIEEISDEKISDKSQLKNTSGKSPLFNNKSSEVVAVQKLLVNPKKNWPCLTPK